MSSTAYNAFLFSLNNMVDKIPDKNPYICYRDGRPTYSRYVDYSKGPFPWIDETNMTKIRGWDSCLWQFRAYLYEIQLEISKFLFIADPDLLSRLLTYNVSDPNIDPWDRHMNCFNPIYSLPRAIISYLENYTIDWDKIPPEKVERWNTDLRNVGEYTLTMLEACETDSQEFQDWTTSVLRILAICAFVALLIVTVVSFLVWKMVPEIPNDEVKPLTNGVSSKIRNVFYRQTSSPQVSKKTPLKEKGSDDGDKSPSSGEMYIQRLAGLSSAPPQYSFVA